MRTQDEISYFGLTFWVHLFLILIANASPILFSWYWILVGSFALITQFVIFKGCVMTHAQFGKTTDLTFYTVYLEKLGFQPNRIKLKRYLQLIHPFVLTVLGFTLQTFFSEFPLIF